MSYLSHDRYLVALKRQLARIEADLPLVTVDSDTIGDKYTHVDLGPLLR